jgi:hypothetical protein
VAKVPVLKVNPSVGASIPPISRDHVSISFDTILFFLPSR